MLVQRLALSPHSRKLLDSARGFSVWFSQWLSKAMLVLRQPFAGHVGCDYKMSVGLNVTKVVCIFSCNELAISVKVYPVP